MTNAEAVQAAKAEFADRFLKAVTSGSVELCANLVLPFREYQLLTNDTKTKEKKYRKALHKQCAAFLQKYQSFFDKHGDRLTSGTIADVYVHRLGDFQELTKDVTFADCSWIDVYMQERTLGNGDLAKVHFKLEHALFVNDAFFVHNFMMVEAAESIDTTTKNVRKLEDLGFRLLHKDHYAVILHGQPPSYARQMSNYDTSLFYDGDLTLDAEHVELLKHQGLLVSGNLTIDGVLHCNDMAHLLVLGDVQATSIIIEEGSFLVKGTARFDDALIILGGDGTIEIAFAQGPLIYNESEAAEIHAIGDAVRVNVDYEADTASGIELLRPGLTLVEDGDVLMDIGALYAALINGDRLRLAP